MAKRIATVYVKACLRLNEGQMASLMQMFHEQHLSAKMKVFENGNQELVLFEGIGEEITLAFERQANEYVLDGSYSLSTPRLTNVMRKAIAEFKGQAIVNRIYPSFTMIYHYENGTVVKIVEKSGTAHKVIYEYRNTLAQLGQLFANKAVENEINVIFDEINELLDRRNRIETNQLSTIDGKLQKLAHRLFVLEA